MLRSLFSGISGLRAHQQMMDVTGNNIANVNTAGFKTSQTVFEDTLSQMINAAALPRNGFGGTNPAQVGLGVRMAGISTNFAQGSAQVTGRSTDLMISGDGFFVLSAGGEQLFARAGAFSFDSNGLLVNPEGLIVQGWLANATGVVDPNAAPGDVRIPVGTLIDPTATANIELGGNLPGDSTVGTKLTQSLTAYDDQGKEITVTATWTNVSATSWTIEVDHGTPPVSLLAPTPVDFAADGTGPTPPTFTTIAGPFPAPVTIDISGVTNYAGKATIAALSQDGAGMGSLTGFTIAKDGLITGTFSNGAKQSLAQIALAAFNNANGLEKAGDSTYRTSVNSGLAQLGQPGAGGRGSLQGGALEMSNVDLGQEFTNLIIAQRGFQANSKIISTSDELLQDLVNLKR
jgi:flagellar hook protein FlgE